MLGLIEIKYGKDTAGKILSLSINPTSVGSIAIGATGFFIFLDSVNTTTNQPNINNFSTRIAFFGNSSVDVAAMQNAWINATNQLLIEPQIVTLDFQSQGYIFSQTIIQA
jgi:hypothetical protein